ncbi:MAG: hypothetical protein IJT16_01505 [Lachnospiraceae bacterium]|nr:hypothetical protein [Lachnospiraceae bacterium]
MIHYCKKLYLTNQTKKDIIPIKLKLYTGAGMLGIYVIMLSKNPEDVLDIVPAAMFKQKRFRKERHVVLGIAESWRACGKLVEEMLREHYDVTGSYLDFRRDLEERVVG